MPPTTNDTWWMDLELLGATLGYPLELGGGTPGGTSLNLGYPHPELGGHPWVPPELGGHPKGYPLELGGGRDTPFELGGPLVPGRVGGSP